MHVLAFSGHRPQDLPADMTYHKFADALDTLGMHKRGHDVLFVTGGALGTDQWAAEYARIRGIRYHMHLPFTPEVMSSKWRTDDKQRFARLIHDADAVRIIGRDVYDIAMYQRRNESMVDASDYVFALWSGKPSGGTANCVRYALKVGKPTYNLWPLDGKLRPVKGV